MSDQKPSAYVLLRIGAFLIDIFLLAIVTGFLTGIINSQKPVDDGTLDTLRVRVLMGGLASLVSQLIMCCYFAYCESSARQATLGKRLLGLKVTTVDGARITFLRGVGRYFARMLSIFTFGFGLFIAPFTPRRQGLHDLICSTRVSKG